MSIRNFLFVAAMFFAVLARADFDAGLKAARAGAFAVAMREWHPLALKGDAGAQFNLGLLYAQGSGVTLDEQQAAEWFRHAAEQGLAAAQYNLGTLYAAGRGVIQDDREAVAWYRKAAEQGHAGAQNNLGVMYRYGYGVAADPILAFAFFQWASAGDEMARESLRQLSVELKPEQVERAKALASSWSAGMPLSSPGPIASASENAPAAIAPSDQSCPPGGDAARRYTDKCLKDKCVRTYANGCKHQFQASYCYDNKQKRWDWKPEGC